MFQLDTDVLSLLFRGDAQLAARVAAIPADVRVCTSTVNRAEILRGRIDSLLKAADGTEWLAAHQRLADDEERLSRLAVLPVTSTAAVHFDRLRTNKAFKRHRADLLIACIALAHDATLVTRNTRDFQAVVGLKLETW